MKNKYQISRRRFLGQASCAAVGCTTLFSTLLNLKGANAAAMANSSVYLNNDYKALICIFLTGGNDSYNMLIPRGNPEYQEYATTRTNLAIPQNDILPINPLTSDGRLFGLHPAMSEVQQLFNNGRLAFVSNIGSLVEPTTIQQIWNDTANLPLGLLSHSDQIMHWQTALPQARSGMGWGGKMADMIGDMNTNQNISMNISLSGTNVFQTGDQVIEFAIDPYDGSIGITGYNDDWQFNSLRKAAIDDMLARNYEDIYQQTYKNVIKNANDAHLEFSTALDGVPAFNTQFSDDDWGISQSMHMIAKVIRARNTLNVARQTFFIEFGGWDHHDEVLSSQNEMLGILSTALGEFNSAMDEINMSDCVTTFTVSEFSRTLTSNGNGTDHAWGANVMVMGGAVNGQEIYGSYPTLALNSNIDLGGGVLLPALAADEYFAELAMWFGVPNSDLPLVLPNIGNFYSVGSNNPPIGFLQFT